MGIKQPVLRNASRPFKAENPLFWMPTVNQAKHTGVFFGFRCPSNLPTLVIFWEARSCSKAPMVGLCLEYSS